MENQIFRFPTTVINVNVDNSFILNCSLMNLDLSQWSRKCLSILQIPSTTKHFNLSKPLWTRLWRSDKFKNVVLEMFWKLSIDIPRVVSQLEILSSLPKLLKRIFLSNCVETYFSYLAGRAKTLIEQNFCIGNVLKCMSNLLILWFWFISVPTSNISFSFFA